MVVVSARLVFQILDSPKQCQAKEIAIRRQAMCQVRRQALLPSPLFLSPMSPRARREPSGLFSLFQPAQIQQFKEAFQLIDHDKDGWVTEPDLRQIFASLGPCPPPLPVPSSPPAGISPPQAMLDGLLDARPGASATHPADTGINFTMFLTMMSERLFEFDPEADLKDAFECFDEADSGLVKVDEMRKWLADVGERMDQQQVPFQISPPPPLTVPQIDKFLNGPFTDRHGNFNYREWIKVLRVNDDVDDPEPS